MKSIGGMFFGNNDINLPGVDYTVIRKSRRISAR